MTYFHSFSAPVRAIFCGNFLLLLCSIFYLIWWIVCFGPNASGAPVGSVCISLAFLTGIAAIILCSRGIARLAPDSTSVPVKYILTGCAILYFLLLLVTALAFHRQVTSELLIIDIFGALQLCAVAVLFGTGRFGAGRALTLAVLVGLATGIGLICYLLYYRLGAVSGFRVGMVPLVTDGLVLAVFLILLATARGGR